MNHWPLNFPGQWAPEVSYGVPRGQVIQFFETTFDCYKDDCEVIVKWTTPDDGPCVIVFERCTFRFDTPAGRTFSQVMLVKRGALSRIVINDCCRIINSERRELILPGGAYEPGEEFDRRFLRLSRVRSIGQEVAV